MRITTKPKRDFQERNYLLEYTPSGQCTQHAIEQMHVRYGLTLDKPLQELIHRRIQSGRAHPIKSQPNDAGTFLIEIAGQPIGLIYGIDKFRIITVLPPTDLRVMRHH